MKKPKSGRESALASALITMKRPYMDQPRKKKNDSEYTIELKRSDSIILYRHKLKEEITSILDKVCINNLTEVIVVMKVNSKDKSLSFLDGDNNVIFNISIIEIFPNSTNEFIESFISVLKKGLMSISLEKDSINVCLGDKIFELRINLPPRDICKDIINIMRYINPLFIDYPKNNNIKDNKIKYHSFNPCDVYDEILKDFPSYEAIKNIRSSLYDYQLKAINWLLSRENYYNEREIEKETEKGKIHPLWFKLYNLNNNNNNNNNNCYYYYSPYSGSFSKVLIENENDTILGGILADEMGLGKTIEILSLILLHQHPNKQIFMKRFKERSSFSNEREVYHVTFISKIENYQSKPLEFEKVINEEIICSCYCGDFSYEDELIRCSKCGRYMHKSCGTIHEYIDEGKLCINCENDSNNNMLECHSTLIISPSSIIDQWISEIMKHFYPNTFKYVVYNGIEKEAKHGDYYNYSPRYLSQFDIVFTTYEVFQSEIYYHIDDNPYQSRSPKKYYSILSPLIRMKWWRVCLDEAQMVESRYSNVTLMALKIPTVNRWCVSGTPISQSLDDIYGLFVYLKVPIYSVKSIWDYCIKTPYEVNSLVGKHLLLDILYKLMWRTSKVQLPSNLLPPQISELLSLNFSPIERNFYTRQCEKCTYSSTRILNKLKSNSKNNNNNNSHISKNDLLKAMVPLLKLRQACCHPQIGSNGLKTKSKSAMTMEEVLEKLIKDCQLDCEEYQRQYIASLNGLSALNQISNNREVAISFYETILSLVKDNDKLIRADKLPIIHTKKNLSELLNHQNHICNNNNNSDKNTTVYCGKCLVEEANKIEKEYMFESNERVEKEYNELNKCEKKIKEKGKVEDSIDWMIAVINDMKNNNSYIYNTFINECIEDLQIPSLSYLSLGSKIEKHYTDLLSIRKDVLNNIKQFNQYPSKEEVYETANCSTCKEGKNGKKCKHCYLYDKIDDYKLCLVDKRKETKRNKISIFGSDSESEEEDDKNKHILHKDISLERENPLIVVYRRIDRYINTFLEDEDIKEKSKKLLFQFDLFKEERLQISHLWEAQHIRLGNIDELEMATLKIRLAYPGEKVKDIDKSWILQPYELDQKYTELDQDRISSFTLLKKNTGQLHYLLFLKSSYEKGETLNCVVCLQPMDLSNISMFPCGHAITPDCFKGLCRIASHERNIKCPVCKRLSRISDVYQVSPEKENNSIQSTLTTKTSDNNNNAIQSQPPPPIQTPRIVLPPIRGSYGTKIDAIVAKLIEIQNNQLLSTNIEKAIVFSMWESVLDILEQALEKNNIPYYRISQKKKFGSLLKQFKNKPIFTVLLLSLKFGGKGLTIIEATHVLLVEPSLNPGVEEQAIGRIHRIGQTNTTYVHHFIINDSIEEKIKQLKETKSQNEKWKVSSSGSDILSISELDDLYGSIKRKNYTAASNDNNYNYNPNENENDNENDKKRRKVQVSKKDLVSVEDEIDNDMDNDDNEDLLYWESRDNTSCDSRRNVLAYSRDLGGKSNESVLFHGLLLPSNVVDYLEANYS